MDFGSSAVTVWKEALNSYPARIELLNKPNLTSLDQFYRIQLPSLLHKRNPNAYITTDELSKLVQWKLSRGKWRPRLLDFVSSLEEELVKSISRKAFQSLPDVSKAVTELTLLKGVGPATASAVLAAYAPDIAPFMSDEAMESVFGCTKQYTLKQYLSFVDKLTAKAKQLSSNGDLFTPSDVERALWSSAVQAKLPVSQPDPVLKTSTGKNTKRKRKR